MQRITQWGEYGVHAALFIARRHAEGFPLVSALEVSEAQSIALNYTQQILVKLRVGGIVDSERGPKGGYRLARPPADINLRDVLLSCEGDTMDIICDTRPLSLERCSPEAKCYLRSVWVGLKETIDKYLSTITLDTLLLQMGESDLKSNSILVSLPVSAKILPAPFSDDQSDNSAK